MNKLASKESNKQRGIGGVKILFAVLIAWGLLIAIGSFQTQASTDFRRPLIVGLTMGAFLSVWAVALKMKSRTTD